MHRKTGIYTLRIFLISIFGHNLGDVYDTSVSYLFKNARVTLNKFKAEEKMFHALVCF